MIALVPAARFAWRGTSIAFPVSHAALMSLPCRAVSSASSSPPSSSSSSPPSSLPAFLTWRDKLLSTPAIISHDLITAERAKLLACTLPTRFGTVPIASIREGSSLHPGDSLILFPPTVSERELSPDGSTSFPLASPPPDVFNTRMWVGGSFTFSPSPLNVSSTVEEALSVESVELKKGGELCFVVTKRTVGEVGAQAAAVEERRTHVYRYRTPTEGSKEPSLPPPPTVRPPATPDFSLPPMLITPVTLFRFSALTFNAHLIHYSLPYCRDVESLPGPLIHGPLTALLLLDLVRAQLPSPAWRIAAFEYKATSPLVVGQSLDLLGNWSSSDADDGSTRTCEVWAVGEQGRRVGMTGRAVITRAS